MLIEGDFEGSLVPVFLVSVAQRGNTLKVVYEKLNTANCIMTYLSRDDLATVHRCLSDSKLDEAYSAHGQSGHRFEWKTFTRPSYCNHCTNLLWGLTNQGLVCEGWWH